MHLVALIVIIIKSFTISTFTIIVRRKDDAAKRCVMITLRNGIDGARNGEWCIRFPISDEDKWKEEKATIKKEF